MAAVVYLLNEKSLWRRNTFIPWDLSLHHTLCSSAVSLGDLFFFLLHYFNMLSDQLFTKCNERIGVYASSSSVAVNR